MSHKWHYDNFSKVLSKSSKGSRSNSAIRLVVHSLERWFARIASVQFYLPPTAITWDAPAQDIETRRVVMR
jgi:hypothetical protein